MDIKQKEYFLLKQNIYHKLFISNSIIYWYDIPEVIGRARNLYIDDIPLSIYLLNPEKVKNNCYVCSFLLAMCFQDFFFEHFMAEINALRYSRFACQNLEDNVHCFIVVKMNGKEFVADPSNVGFLVDKNSYFELEQPKVMLKLSISKVLSKYCYGFSDVIKNPERLMSYLSMLIDSGIEDESLRNEVLFYKDILGMNRK